MGTAQPSTRRRRALLDAVRSTVREDGHEAGSVRRPDLASALVLEMSAHLGERVRERAVATRHASLDAFVETLVDTAVEVGREWRDGLVLANLGIERMTDFEGWQRMLAPAHEAIEAAIERAQEQGLVRRDLDPHVSALVLRDVLDRTAKTAVLFGGRDYRRTATALVCASLRD
jgi:hypothetical protein